MRRIDPAAAVPAPEPSPAAALLFVWRGRWTIVLVTLLAAAASVYFADRRGTIWRARSVLYVQREAPMMPGSDVSLWLQSRNFANTQAALLRSTPVLQAGLERAAVDDSGLFGDSHNHLGWLRRRLNVAVGSEDELISISLDAVQVDAACTVVNAVVDAYLEFRSRNQRETATEVRGNLGAELARYEAELRAVQTEQVAFLAAHPGLRLADDAAKVEGERLRELTRAMTQAEIESMQADAAWGTAARLAEHGDVRQQLALAGNDSGLVRSITDELQRLQDLQARRGRMLATVTSAHPDAVELDGRIAAATAEVATAARAVATACVATLDQRRAGARRLFEDLRSRVAEQEARMQASDPAQAEYRGLGIRFDRARKLADSLYERIRAIDINQGLEATEAPQLSALVYEHATAAGAGVASSKTAIAAIGTFLGLLVGIGLAWVRSLFDQRLRGPADVVGFLPLLSVLPRVAVASGGIAATWNASPEFVAAMRSLRTVIHFGLRSTGNRLLQVTSPAVGDGKSFVAAGLAIAMARSGQRTLLVDADFGRPMQGRMFGIEATRGLRQLLSERGAAATAVVATQVPNLSLLAAGELEAGAADQLDATRLASVLQELAPTFDRIVIDSPPLLAVVDARIVAAVADGTLLVVRAGRTTHRMVESAMGIVASVAGRLCGAVLNRAARSTDGGSGGSVERLRGDPLGEPEPPLGGGGLVVGVGGDGRHER